MGSQRPERAVPVAPPGGAHSSFAKATEDKGVTRPTPPPEVQAPAKAEPVVEKTFSDAEILASVSPPPKKVETSPRPSQVVGLRTIKRVFG
jgi:hypothetical protein